MDIWTLDKMPPIHAVSHYLMVLLEDHTLPNGTKYPVVATYDECVQLHSCNPKNLVPTILNIFKGVPEVFQVFQCKLQTTEDELRLFLERADQYTFLHVLLEVNKLSFQTQEVYCIKCVLDFITRLVIIMLTHFVNCIIPIMLMMGMLTNETYINACN